MILGYCRVSSLDQVQGTSLDQQEAIIRGYAQMKGASKFDVQIFRDAGWSGSAQLGQRPGGEKLLASAQSGDTVVASKLDRMFRSSTDALQIAEQFKAKGISLVLLDLGMESITSDGVSKFIFTVLAAMAAMERDRINERCKDGRAFKKAGGGPVGNVPFGYKKIGHGRSSTLQIDPREIEAAQMAKKLSRKGWINRQISDAMAESGFLARSGDPYTLQRVQKMIDMQLPVM